jgi:tRNA U54 and U55 pseudouridine synthase Pus10
VYNKNKEFEDMYITIAIDSNGIRVPIEANGLETNGIYTKIRKDI